MADQPYRKPPITEAVIEIRFAEVFESSELEKAVRQIKSGYSHDEQVRNIGFSVGVSPEGPVQTSVAEQSGRRMSSDDLTQIAVLWPSIFSVSQLAPYPGWDSFFERFTRDWIRWKRAMNYRKITRVGVRFINRLDIPVASADMAAVDEADYLNVYPKLPSSLRPAASYAVQAQVSLPDIGCGLMINSGVVPAPLIRSKSYLLDLDVAKDADPPQTDELIYELLNLIRDKKNQIFEECVTDRAKEIFR